MRICSHNHVRQQSGHGQRVLYHLINADFIVAPNGTGVRYLCRFLKSFKARFTKECGRGCERRVQIQEHVSPKRKSAFGPEAMA